MRFPVLPLALILSALSYCPLLAQQQLFSTYSINEGLVQNAMRDIYQDTRGFMWFGTWEGLSRYDGYRFTNYTTANGLSQSVINKIAEVKPGVIYITGNDGSLSLVQNGVLRTIVTKGPVINNIQPLPGHKLIASTDHYGLCEFSDGKLVKPQQPSPSSNYYAVAPFNDSLFVALSEESVQLLTYDYRLYAEYRAGQKYFTECGLLTDSKKRIWIGTMHGLRLLSPVQEKNKPLRFEPLPSSFSIPGVKDEWIKDILEDSQGNIWVGTVNGLARISKDGSAQQMTEKNGLPASDIDCLYEDKEQNIWIGTSKGVTKLVTKAGITIYNEQAGLFSNDISYLFPLYDGSIIAGTGNKMQRFNQSNNTFSNIPADKTYYSFSDNKASLALVPGGKYQTSFVVFPAGKKEPVYFSHGSAGGYFACKDLSGNYFFATNEGLLFSKDFVNWQPAFLPADMRTILIDNSNTLWVGSFDTGLFRIRYEYVNDTPHIIKKDHFFAGLGFRSLYQDSKGYIWAGSRFNGAYRFLPDENPEHSALHIDRSAGLTSDRIVSIAEDRNGSIWLNFYQGLDKLVPSGNTYRVFNFSRFYNFFSNIQSLIFDKQHSLWLATTQGVVHINDSNTENSPPAKVYITSSLLGDSTWNEASDKNIQVSYRHKQVQFEFAAPGFLNEKQVQYSYRLLGSNNEEWSSPSGNHLVSFANLDQGTYRFEVRTAGWNGQWSEPAVFRFTINPPFWKTFWFRISVLLLMAGIIYWLVRRRIKNIRHEAEMKQKISESEMMALRAQMNPHFIFNCLNAIDNLVQTNQKEKATTYLARFARLIRNVLESSKHNLIPFQKDFESLKLYLQMEQFRCDNKFSYELTASDELLHSDIKVPPLIIQPFVENAIHHGLLNKLEGERKLSVESSLENEYVHFIIMDNGVGRARAQEIKELNKPGHESYGISITEERIHLYNKDSDPGNIKISDLWKEGQPAGTRVDIKLRLPAN